ncbi:MAG: DUF2273 domain-containing protein [Firmicutes bacterium]|nr:DUF2273 domain-containing protein [Bacillota bacterium]
MGCGVVDERLEDLLTWAVANKGKILGTGTGILLGWLTIRYGLAKAIFVLLCLILGYSVGARLDEQKDVRGLLGGLFSSRRR